MEPHLQQYLDWWAASHPKSLSAEATLITITRSIETPLGRVGLINAWVSAARFEINQTARPLGNKYPQSLVNQANHLLGILTPEELQSQPALNLLDAYRVLVGICNTYPDTRPTRFEHVLEEL
jgi:hypothetical protein